MIKDGQNRLEKGKICKTNQISQHKNTQDERLTTRVNVDRNRSKSLPAESKKKLSDSTLLVVRNREGVTLFREF
jgi:hypothetical protein